MKKLLCILVSVFAIGTICNAQLISSKQITKERPHAIWMEISGLIGSDKYTGDASGTISNAGFKISFRWTKRYSDYFAMDYINLGMGPKFRTSKSPSVDSGRNVAGGIFSLCLGPRGFYPINYKNSLFLNYNAGIAYVDFWTDEGKWAFHHEANLGIEFHKRIALSLFFENTPKINDHDDSGYSCSGSQTLLGLKFGFSF